MLSSAEEVPVYGVFTAIVRDFRPTDLSFLMKTWLHAYQPERYHAHKSRYYAKQQDLIRYLCTKDNSRIAVVCDQDAPDFVVGFAIAEAPASTYRPMVVHYVYVKKMYRKQGFAKMMMRSLGWFKERKILATHWAKGLSVFKKHCDLEHDDWILKGFVNPNEQ